jgi:hypothetical protein
MKTTLIGGRGKDNSISGMLLATGEFVQCGYQSHMALFPLLKTARVASGENSLALMLYLYLQLTYWFYGAVTKFFRREILADQQLKRHEKRTKTPTTLLVTVCITP